MKTSSPESSKPRSAAPAFPPVTLRELRPSDRAPIERILHATGAFGEAEVAVALELVDSDPAEGYRFLVAEDGDRVAGYACYGATPMTDGVFDLYWIVVDPEMHGHGIGRALMKATEEAIRAAAGRMMVIETGGKPSYARQRAFYESCGCREVARVPDFYAVGDDKVIYARRIG